ncbi:hypothetical protein VYU27_007490 [Nannochloropsis oceanica]
MSVTDENALLPGLPSHEEEVEEMELYLLHHDEEQQEEDENDFQGFDLDVEDDKINNNNSSITSDTDAIAMATAETTSDTGTISTRNKASRKPSGIALAFAKPDVSPEEAEEYVKKHLMLDAMLREGNWRIKEAPRYHANRSPIWTYGVMYDRPAVGSVTAQRRW